MSFLNMFGRLFITTCKLCFTGCFLGVLGILCCTGLYAEAALSKENKLKAAYLFNFTKFIEWPDLGKMKPSYTIRICVNASPEFLQFLSLLVANRRVGRLQNEVTVLALSTASGCELLYVQGLQNVASMDLDNTIVVADFENDFSTNAAILFYTQDRKLRFEIDLEKIKTLNVTFSSELLKLARIK